MAGGKERGGRGGRGGEGAVVNVRACKVLVSSRLGGASAQKLLLEVFKLVVPATHCRPKLRLFDAVGRLWRQLCDVSLPT